MKKYPYFKPVPLCADGGAAPEPLRWSVERKVRFEEVDSLRVVWHGRYPSYFEDARIAFGERYGLKYMELYDAGTITPIKQMYIDYLGPLRFGDSCRINIALHWHDAARLNFSYTIESPEGELLTTGYTVQLFLDQQGQVYMFKPDIYADFCERWRRGDF